MVPSGFGARSAPDQLVGLGQLSQVFSSKVLGFELCTHATWQDFPPRRKDRASKQMHIGRQCHHPSYGIYDAFPKHV